MVQDKSGRLLKISIFANFPEVRTILDNYQKCERFSTIFNFARIEKFTSQGCLAPPRGLDAPIGGRSDKKSIDKKSWGWIWDFLAWKSTPSSPRGPFLHTATSHKFPRNFAKTSKFKKELQISQKNQQISAKSHRNQQNQSKSNKKQQNQSKITNRAKRD